MEITAASFTNEAFANLQPRRPRVAKDPSLPVLAARDEVLAAVRGHSTVLVVGETGSGKSTQVPQFLLDAKVDGMDDLDRLGFEKRVLGGRVNGVILNRLGFRPYLLRC